MPTLALSVCSASIAGGPIRCAFIIRLRWASSACRSRSPITSAIASGCSCPDCATRDRPSIRPRLPIMSAGHEHARGWLSVRTGHRSGGLYRQQSGRSPAAAGVAVVGYDNLSTGMPDFLAAARKHRGLHVRRRRPSRPRGWRRRWRAATSSFTLPPTPTSASVLSIRARILSRTPLRRSMCSKPCAPTAFATSRFRLPARSMAKRA